MPIDLIRCSPDRSCTIEHRVAGLYVLDKEEATDLTTADTGSEQMSRVTVSGFGSGRQPRTQGTVVLSGKAGTASTFPKHTPFPSDNFVKNSVQRFLSAPNGKSYTMLQGEVGFVVVIIGFLGAIRLLRLAFKP